MNEHTVRRSIVIAVVWMVVLGTNATAAYALTTNALAQEQSGLILFEGDEGRQPLENAPSIDERLSGADDQGAGSPLIEPATASPRIEPSASHRSNGAGDAERESTFVGNDDEAGRNNERNHGDHDQWDDRRNHDVRGRNGNGNSGPEPLVGGANTCTAGELLAKYEVRGNGFVFEKGTDLVTITDVRYDEDGEVKAFAFETSAFVSTAGVKFGPETQTVDIDGRVGTIDLTSEQHAISNVVFCQNPFYQVDFVTGPPVEQLSAGDLYGDRKVQFVTGVVGKDDPQTRSDGDRPTCLASTDDIEIIEDGTAASVTFDVGERCELSLVSYETQTLRFDRATAPQQTLVDSVTRTFDPGRYEITVSLPDTRPSGTEGGS